MKRLVLVSGLSAALSVSLATVRAHAADSPLGLSVSLERVAGIAYGSARPTTSDTGFTATSSGIAGPAINPIALPRLAADAILPMGLTLGGAIGFGYASVSVNPDHNPSSNIAGDAWIISPRVGYLFHLSPMLDLWPRAGVTFAAGNLQEPDSQNCVSSSVNGMVIQQSCTTNPGASDSVFFAAVSVDVAAALRITRSFNVLAGIAYDQVFAAGGSTSNRSNSTDIKDQGQYLGGQIWFGLGGYVL